MTLQEKLKELGIETTDINEINALVDTLIENKTMELETKTKELREKYSKYEKQEKMDSLSSFLPKNANKDMMEDIIKLSDISDEDSDEVKTKKITEAVNSRKYLQVEAKDNDIQAPKKEKKEEVIVPKKEEKVDDSDVENPILRNL